MDGSWVTGGCDSYIQKKGRKSALANLKRQHRIKQWLAVKQHSRVMRSKNEWISRWLIRDRFVIVTLWCMLTPQCLPLDWSLLTHIYFCYTRALWTKIEVSFFPLSVRSSYTELLHSRSMKCTQSVKQTPSSSSSQCIYCMDTTTTSSYNNTLRLPQYNPWGLIHCFLLMCTR